LKLLEKLLEDVNRPDLADLGILFVPDFDFALLIDVIFHGLILWISSTPSDDLE